MFIPFYFLLMAVATSLALFEHTDEKKNRTEMLVFFSFVMILFAVAAFRPIGIDQDSVNYVALFNGQENEEIEMEWSFNLIVDFCHLFTDDPRLLFIIYALLAIPIKAVGMARASRTWMLSLVVWSITTYIKTSRKSAWQSQLVFFCLACAFFAKASASSRSCYFFWLFSFTTPLCSICRYSSLASNP